ncbi:MAG TPA: RsmE family RNA methyltransferase [Bellilinea sp.]|nr:RsmE family RNA methyltransferase [Bellilinea sp.]
MHRFFLPPSAIQADPIFFPSDNAHQIFRVLRLRSGDQVTVLDGLGWQYRVELTVVSRKNVSGRVLEKSAISSEPPVHLSMYLCLTQREKFEWILQKCTEVGASEFTPVLSSRSLVQAAESLDNKHPRWQRILQEAAEQSGRGQIPLLNNPLDFAAVLATTRSQFDICLVAWEEENVLRLTDALQGLPANARIALLIGPEGGLTHAEVESARENSWKAVSLGPRILRMETAAVVSAALVIDWFESRAG